MTGTTAGSVGPAGLHELTFLDSQIGAPSILRPPMARTFVPCTMMAVNDTTLMRWPMGTTAVAYADARAADLAEDFRLLRRNVAALGDAIRALDVRLPPGVVVAAANVQNLFDDIEREFGLFTSTQAGARMGSRSTATRNAATSAHSDGRLLAIRRGRYLLFPGFQFDRNGIRPVIAELKSVARRHDWDDVAVIEWVMAPTTYLSGRRPVDVMDDPSLLLHTAEAAFGVTW